VLTAIAFAAGWWLKPAPPRAVTRFSLPLAEGQTFTRRGRHTVAVSPDGTKIAYIASQQIFLRVLHQLEAQPIRGTQMDPAELAFSPDGDSIAFVAPTEVGGSFANAALKKIRVAGGTAVTLCTLGPPFGIRWQGDRIVFSTGTDIKVVADTGGEPQTLLSANLESGETLAQPQLLQDGKALLYTVRARNASFDDAEVAIQPIGGTRRVLVAGGMDGRALEQGLLVYVRNSILFAQAFNSSTLQIAGGPRPLLEQLSVGVPSGAGQFSVSDTGTLVFIQSSGSPVGELAWIDRKGKEEALAAPAKSYGHPRVSPDGARIVVDTPQGDDDIWIWDDARHTLTRLTAGPARDSIPVWSRDGRWIIYRSDSEGQVDLFRRAADGTGTTERLTNTPDAEAAIALLPDTTRLLVRLGDSGLGGAGRLSVMTAGSATAPEPVIPTAGMSQLLGEVSPDGRWLAYESRESGSRGEIFVRPFPNTDTGRWQVSVAGGTRPVWSQTGRELFFVTERPAPKMMVVAVQPSPSGQPFNYRTPTTLFEVSARVRLGSERGFDVTPDGLRFLVIRADAAEGAMLPLMTIVTGWTDELKAQFAER
jgi:Tol biopolymer transport system component